MAILARAVKVLVVTLPASEIVGVVPEVDRFHGVLVVIENEDVRRKDVSPGPPYIWGSCLIWRTRVACREARIFNTCFISITCRR